MQDWNRSDLNAIVAACRTAARRVTELCDRFGPETYLVRSGRAAAAQLDAMKQLIATTIPAERDADLHRLRLRRRHGLRALQDPLLDVPGGRRRRARLRRHRPAVAGLDQLLPQREHVQDVLRDLHDHGLRPADPLERRLLPARRRPDPGGHAAQAALPGGAVLPHPRARPHLRHPRRPARPAAAGVPLRRRVLLVAAPDVFSGYRAGRRVVPALPDRLRRHPGPAVRRRAGRALAVAVVHQRAQRVPGGVLPAAHRVVRDRRRTPAAPGFFRGGNGIDVVYRFLEPGDDLHPRRPLVHLPLGRQRRRAGGALAQVARARRRHAGRCCPASATTSGSRPATCCTTSPGAAAAGATRTPGIPTWSRSRSGAGWSARDGARRYGVVLAADGSADRDATESLRRELSAQRGETQIFVRGPDIDELRERCLEETGLPAPRPPVFRTAGAPA